MKIITYKPNQLIGPKGITFIRDLPSHKTPGGQTKRWGLFGCSCGIEFESSFRPIIKGQKSNCGCGAKSGRQVHKMTGTKIRRCWSHIKSRCLDPKHKAYPLYGGRGITLYPDWVHNFMAFNTYVSLLPGANNPTLSLDRVENSGNYEPGNLRWATKREQALNRRPRIKKTNEL